MSDSTNLRVTELDFDQIKSNLKTYLQGQSQFTDYDFDGSSLSILLDILAYNTHYNAIYANLVANEMFLDSASQRESVVSLAKHFGYTPSSMSSARAQVNLTITTTGSPQSLMLPKYTPFTTTIDGTDYTFYNLSNITTTPLSANVFYFQNLVIVEGVPLTYRYTVQNNQKTFLIPNKNVDTSTLTVEVQNSGTDATRTVYSLAGNNDFTTISGTDPVYFLEETRDGFFRIVFGDDVIGKSLKNGNVVNMSYLVSNGTAANNAKSFALGGITSFVVSNSSLTLAKQAAGGSEVESIDSVRYNASKFFVTQNRAVTSEDYKNIILKEYPSIDAISAWGGDTANPPVYGKVFISAKPVNGTVLTTEVKSNLLKILGSKNVVGITPEFVDAEFLYIEVDTKFYYDPSKTVAYSSSIEANVLSTIQNFKDADLDNFDSVFRKSKLQRLIDYTDKSILNNNTEINLYKIIPINSESELTYTINFSNPIQQITSSGFRIFNDSQTYYVKDDGDGNLIKYYMNNGKEIIDNKTFGVVNYNAGRITIPNVRFSLLTNNCKLYAVPSTPDVISVHNQIITILDSDITVKSIADSRKPMVR